MQISKVATTNNGRLSAGGASILLILERHRMMVRLNFLLVTLFSQMAYTEDCMDVAITQAEINKCAYRKSQDVESLLYQLETEVASSLKGDAQSKFLKSQQAWWLVVSYDCDIESAFFSGGSVEPAIYASCKEAHIRRRILRVRYFLCPSWAMTNDCPAEARYDVRL